MRGILSAILLAASVVLATGAMARAGSLLAKVDISSQTMTVSEYGRVVYRWKVSTARPGYRTPRGSYRPIRLHRMWRSRKYHNSPMPYSVFFHGGYAIHGTYETRNLGRPASHGCVRLHPEDAATFFALVKEAGAGNTRIVVAN
jgi:lipoprotein-anchoring transpeptidase ErfK/SrfK